jgi:4'-phosphopantetheinyl transferase
MAQPRVSGPTQQLARLAREAHVWLARPDALHDPILLEGYHALLSPEEHERYRRFLREPDRHHFLVSHALVRCALSRYADVRPGAWEFIKGEHDKPEISGPAGAPPLRFNLSHSSGLVACVVCAEIDCGVDVERIGRVKDLAGVAKRILTEGEQRALFSCEGHAREVRFTEYWTLKEAYVKARGIGFQLPLHTVHFELDRGGRTPAITLDEEAGDRAEHWQLALQPADQSHLLAVALRRGAEADREIVVFEEWPEPLHAT